FLDVLELGLALVGRAVGVALLAEVVAHAVAVPVLLRAVVVAVVGLAHAANVVLGHAAIGRARTGEQQRREAEVKGLGHGGNPCRHFGWLPPRGRCAAMSQDFAITRARCMHPTRIPRVSPWWRIE